MPCVGTKAQTGLVISTWGDNGTVTDLTLTNPRYRLTSCHKFSVVRVFFHFQRAGLGKGDLQHPKPKEEDLYSKPI